MGFQTGTPIDINLLSRMHESTYIWWSFSFCLFIFLRKLSFLRQPTPKCPVDRQPLFRNKVNCACVVSYEPYYELINTMQSAYKLLEKQFFASCVIYVLPDGTIFL